jgi:hypothetical protein
MRCLIKVEMPVEQGNQIISEGRLGPTLGQILNDLQPEAAYFVAENGTRSALIFAHIADPSQIPAIAEPFFQAFNAKVEITPAMTAEDLQRAGQAIERAAQTYGHGRQHANR